MRNTVIELSSPIVSEGESETQYFIVNGSKVVVHYNKCEEVEKAALVEAVFSTLFLQYPD